MNLKENIDKMKIENTTYATEQSFTFTSKNKWGYTFKVSSDSTNCKLGYIHGAGSLKEFKDDEKKQVLDYLLTKSKGAVIINTIYERVTDWIKDNYDTYYYVKVPIGYGMGYQYHICIRNNKAPNSSCRKPELVNQVIDIDLKTNLKAKIKAKLKELRRKDDYVDNLVDELI